MKAMPWLRVYTEMPGDMKLRRVAKLARAPMATVLSVWVCMLCHAGGHAGDSRGTLAGWDDGTIATGLDLEDEQVTAIRAAMQGLLLDGEVLIGWERRQGELLPTDGRPASTSAERMRRMRERKAAATGGDDVTDVTRDVTPVTPEASSPATMVTAVTEAASHVTPVADVTALEERREEEEKRIDSSGFGEGVQGEVAQRADRAPQPQPNQPTLAAPKPTRQPRGFRLPGEWAPRDDALELASRLGLDGHHQAGRFRDHWKAEDGPNSKKLDWDAAFRTWLHRANDRQHPSTIRLPAASAQERAASRHAEAVDELGRYLNEDPMSSGIGAGVVFEA